VSLKIISSDRGEKMWSLLEKRFYESDALLVLPGNFARNRFLENLEIPIFGEKRVYTFLEFWDYLAFLLREESSFIPSELEVEVLREEVRDLLHLSSLGSDSLPSLASHLKEIEEEADLSFTATNVVEEEINSLRAVLNDKGAIFQGAWRSRIARQLQELLLDRPVIFAHLPEPSKQLAGMIKGLSKKNEVFYYPLLGDFLLPSYLKMLAIDDFSLEREEKNSGISLLFKESEAEDEREISFLFSGDEAKAALSCALALYQSGEKRIAIVSSGGEADRRQIIKKAEEHGVPLLFRNDFRAQDTLLGSIFLSITSGSEDDIEDIILDAQPIYEIAREDLEGLFEKKGEDLMRSLLLLGDKILQQNKADSKEYLLQDALKHKLEVLLEAGFPLGDVYDFIKDTATPRQAFGVKDGIMLLSPAEVAGYKLDHLIFFHLSADDYPSRRTPSAFFSEELLALNPDLGAKDKRSEFLAALMSPRKSITLIRDSRSEASSYYLECMRLLQGEEKYFTSTLSRSIISDKARKRLAAHPDISQALERITKEDFPFQAERQSSFGVTELESYLTCPLGWFVQYQIKPKGPQTLAQRRGSALHLVLEELFSYPADERISLLAETLEKHTDSFLSPRQRAFDEDSLLRVLQRYGSLEWPFQEHMLEHFLSIEEEINGETVQIKGRIDRIDIRGEEDAREALLIDYKSNKAGNKKDNLLQMTLYPLMVERSLEAACLGFLYVSIFSANHTGSLVREIEGLSSDGVEYNFSTREGLRQAALAIEGIREGNWFTAADDCPAYCAHRLLSKTTTFK
jgi:putative RecB family exonuclease